MNNYFKNYLLVFFSFFVMPVFAMETKNTIPGKELAAELIALTHLPKEKSINKNHLLLEQDRQDAENWFNKGAESIQPRDSQEALLNYLMKYGPYTPNFYTLNSDFISNNKENLQFNGLNTTINSVNSKKYSTEPQRPYLKESNRSRRAATPLKISNEFGMDKQEKMNEIKQNCLLM